MKLALCDDHQLFRKGLRQLIEDFSLDCSILWEAENGQDALHYIRLGVQPDILILDAHMPVLDGAETAAILKTEFPNIKILILSMMDDEAGILYLLRQGVRGFISKDIRPNELQESLEIIHKNGYYFSDAATAQMLSSMQINSAFKQDDVFNEKEQQFLNLACSEFTYKEIAEQMNLSAKTVDGYRNTLFEKMGVKSRVGMVIYALKKGFVHL